jgi:tetratricopeptide (TPR) repeat protein
MSGRVRGAVYRQFWLLVSRLSMWMEFHGSRHGDYWVGVYAMRWGRHTFALRCLSDAQRAYEKSVGPSHGYTLHAMKYRAECYEHLGELANAAELYERVLDHVRAAGRENYPWGRDIQERLDQVNRRRFQGSGAGPGE